MAAAMGQGSSMGDSCAGIGRGYQAPAAPYREIGSLLRRYVAMPPVAALIAAGVGTAFVQEFTGASFAVAVWFLALGGLCVGLVAVAAGIVWETIIDIWRRK